MFTAYRQVPTPTDTKVVLFGNEMNYSLIRCQLTKHFRCAVIAMIIYNDNVVRKICFLGQHTLYGITNGAHSIAHRNDHTRLHGIRCIIMGEVVKFVGCQVCPNALQVVRTSALVFELHFTVLGIHIVKLLFAALSQVGFYLRIKIFVEVEELPHTRKMQTQGIHCRIAVAPYLI